MRPLKRGRPFGFALVDNFRVVDLAMLIPISSQLMPIINECLYIALEATDDEHFAEIIKEVMFQLEQAEMNADDIGSVRFIAGFENRRLN